MDDTCRQSSGQDVSNTTNNAGLHAAESRQILMDILSQFGKLNTGSRSMHCDGRQDGSILQTLEGEDTENSKALLLTLHFLFPHELLPALDLLDRKLVMRHILASKNGNALVFYIQSASAVTDPVNKRRVQSRYRHAFHPTQVFYEVRIDSWNCSCAAFAQSSLKLIMNKRCPQTILHHATASSAAPWFGGLQRAEDTSMPICKHILAALLSEAAPRFFEGHMNELRPAPTETAAWAGGWGED